MIADLDWVFPNLTLPRVDCGAVELDALTFRRPSFPPEEFAAGCDRNYAEDYSIVWGFPHPDSAAATCGAVKLDDLIFHRMSFPQDELPAGRVARRARWRLYMAEPGDWPVSARSTSDWATPLRTSPLRFGHPHGLVYSCFCSTFLSLHCLESVDLTQDRHCRTSLQNASHCF